MSATYAELEALTRTSHRQDATVAAYRPDAGTIDVPVLAATMTFSASTWPRGQLSVTTAIPDTQAGIDLLDPRTGSALLLKAGYVFPSGSMQMLDFGRWPLRYRGTDRAADTFELRAAGAEVVVNMRGVDATMARPAGPDTQAEIEQLLTYALPGVPVVRQSARLVPFAGYTLDPGAALWQTIEDLGDAAGVETFWDGSGFVVRDQRTVSGSPVATLQTGPNGTVWTSTMDANADLFANGVLLTFSWSDPAPSFTQHTVTGTARITAGPWAWGGIAGQALYVERRQTPVSQAQADQAAASLLVRRLAAGRGAIITAVSALWLRPGDTVQVQLPLGDAVLQIVQQVSFDLTAGRMTVTTRDPSAPDTVRSA